MRARGQWRGLWILGILALAVVGTAGAWVAARAPEYPIMPVGVTSDILFQAKIDCADRDWARAEELLSNAGQSFEARLLLGRVLLERGRLAEAQNIFTAALKGDPKSFEATCGMAMVWEGMGQKEMAVSLWQKALSLRKDDAWAWKRLAMAQKDAGDSFGALSSVQESLKLDPKQEDLKRLQSELALAGIEMPGVPKPQGPAAFGGATPNNPPRPAVPQPPDPTQWFPKPNTGIER